MTSNPNTDPDIHISRPCAQVLCSYKSHYEPDRSTPNCLKVCREIIFAECNHYSPLSWKHENPCLVSCACTVDGQFLNLLIVDLEFSFKIQFQIPICFLNPFVFSNFESYRIWEAKIWITQLWHDMAVTHWWRHFHTVVGIAQSTLN